MSSLNISTLAGSTTECPFGEAKVTSTWVAILLNGWAISEMKKPVGCPSTVLSAEVRTIRTFGRVVELDMLQDVNRMLTGRSRHTLI